MDGAMNERIKAAMMELNNLHWDEVLQTRPLSQKFHSIVDPPVKNVSVADHSKADENISLHTDEHDHQQDTYVSYNDLIFEGQNMDAVQRPHTNEEALDETPIDQDDEESDNSDQPVLGDQNDDFLMEELSGSISSSESVNDFEILAQDNAEKNRDILHESFLDEARKNFLAQAAMRKEAGGDGDGADNLSYDAQPGGPHSYNSVEGDTKSVTFADENYIVEFDTALEFPAIIPLNMDPFDEYLTRSEDGPTDGSVEAIDTRFDDGISALDEGDDHRSDSPRHDEDCHEREQEQYQDQSIPESPMKCDYGEGESPGGDFSLLRLKFEQLMLSSPQFRDAVMAFPVGDEEADSDMRREAELRLLESIRPTDRKVTLKKSYQPFSDVPADDTSEAPPTEQIHRTQKSKRAADYRKKAIGGRAASPSRVSASSPMRSLPPIGGNNSRAKRETNVTDLLAPSSYSSQRSAAKDFLERLAEREVDMGMLDTTPSLEHAPPPPKLCTDYPNIPTTGIDLLNEMNQTGNNFLIPLEPFEEKLRMRIKATDCPSDWEYSNRMDFFGLHFSRSEFMEFPRAAQRKTGSELEMDDNEVGAKRKLLINHDDAYEFLYVNRSKFLKKTKPHVAQLNSFVHKYFLGFTFLVFDMKMQIIGTFDHKLGKHCPGVTVCPPHLHKRKRRSDDHRFANLFEIEFSKLPDDIFAIVPVIYDDSPAQAEFPELQLQCDLSLSEVTVPKVLGGRRDSYWMTNTLEEDSEATPLHGQFDVNNAPAHWALLEQVSPSMSTAAPSHVELLDSSWTHLESFFATRKASFNHAGLKGPPKMNISPQQSKSSMVDFSIHHSFVPFVLFQRLDEYAPRTDDDNEDIPKRRSWNLKAMQASIPGVMLHSIIRETLNVLKQQFVVPMHMINIEHCVNCEKHSMTTWHVPGSYERHFIEFKTAFRKSLPPAIIYANKFTADSKSCPRLGSFEITIRPFASSVSQLVFSKLSFKTIPPTDKIIRDLAVLLLPEVVKFQGEHLLELHTYDGYMKKPLRGATVYLYRVEVGVTLEKDVEEMLGETPYDLDALEAAGGVHIDKNGKHKRVKLPPRRIGNSQAASKYSAKEFTSRVMEGNTVEDATFRHSSVFYKVRSWKSDEIAAWFKSFAVGQDVVNSARMHGVVDGPSFLALASVAAFEKWGVKHKLKLFRMEKALEKLREDNGDASSDPYTNRLDVSKDTIPVLCQPATPKPSHVTDDMLMYLVCSKKSDSRGLSFVNVDTAGTYVLRIEAPLSVPYCSNAFNINSAGHSAYCASMKPRIGSANITIELEDDDELQDMAASGILLAMVNMMSGKRHISFAKTSSIGKDDSQEGSDCESDGGIKVSSFQPSRCHSEEGLSSRAAPLRRENTVGAILMRQMTAKKGSTRWGGMDRLDKPVKRKSESTSFLKATIWLPVGKYYSEVTGDVFTIEEDDTPHNTRNDYWDKASELVTSQRKAPKESVEIVYTQHLALKCHNRILSGSVKAFQKIYRHYKKDFLIANLWAYLALKKGLKRLLNRVRVKIANRSATRVQAFYRMRKQKSKLATMRVCVICAQTMIRRWLSIRRAKMLKKKRDLIVRNVRWYAKTRRRKRLNAALVVQCSYRCYCARVVYTSKLFNRRVNLKAKWWFLKVKKITLARLAHEAEIAREARENEDMAAEETFMRDFIIRLAEYKRYMIRRRAAAVESNRMNKAVMLQSHFRGLRDRLALKRAGRIILRLQKIFRIQKYEKKVAAGIHVKYVPSFPMLAKHPQLLGATKLLLGIYKDSDEETVYSYDHLILHKVLHKPAIKVQSMIRMHVERLRYILMRQEHLNDYEFTPPLYRYLIVEEVLSDSDEETYFSTESAMQRYMDWQDMCDEDKFASDKHNYPGRKVWDNGANPLLDKLGYVYNKDESGAFFRPGRQDRRRNSQRRGARNGEDIAMVSEEPVTLDGLVEGFRGLFLNPSRRMAKQYEELYRRSATRIQTRARGFLVRLRIWKAKEKARLEAEQKAAAIQKEIELKRAEREHSRRQMIKKITGFGSNIKRGLQRKVTQEVESTIVKTKALHKQVTREIGTAVEKSSQVVKTVATNVKTQYEESREIAKELAEKAKLETVRKQRLLEHEFCTEDAVFNVRGMDEDGLPRLNRHWYLGVFPQVNEYEIDEASAQQDYLGGHDSEQAYEMSQGTHMGEAVRTASMTPFSKESYHRLNFNTHLADLQRYTRILLVVFVEAGDENGDGAVRPDALPGNISVPSIGRTITPKKGGAIGSTFLPVFFGSCQLNGGLAFAPTGGRMTILLRPNPNQAVYLSRAQARRLSNMKFLRISVTLNPVAIPSSEYLYSLMCKTIPKPIYPSEFIDAYLFEKFELDVKEFYGAAICMIRFAGRNLISTRHRGLPHGVLEFTSTGRCLGKAIEHRPDMGTIQAMIAGHDHMLTCGSTGALAIYMDGNTGVDNPTLELVRYMELHEWPIVLCACVHRAGIDFFFTVDRKDHIGITLMEKGTMLRTFVNQCFVTARISAIAVSRDKLYLGLINGHLITVNISEIMNGNVEVARHLADNVVGRDAIFDETAGITCMTISSQADVFGLINEDTENTELVDVDAVEGLVLPTNVRVKQKPRLVGMRLRPQDKLKHGDIGADDETYYERNSRLKPATPLEGHVLIVAGGSDHLIKILRPVYPRSESLGGVREMACLTGHTAAVSQIVADGAGRFIVSISQTSKHLNVWNATTYNCEKTHENVNAGFIGLGENVMYLCSFKAPFITVWRVPEKSPEKKKKYQKKLTYGEDNFGESSGHDGAADGRPHIAMIRTRLWCSTTVAGGRAIPQRSLTEAVMFLGAEGQRVVNDWRSYYDRGVKAVTKLAPPPLPKKTRSNLSSLLPSIEEPTKTTIRSKRQLQKLATSDNIGSALNTARTTEQRKKSVIPDRSHSFAEFEESHHRTELLQEEEKDESRLLTAYDYTDPVTGYNHIHNCYYDSNGYAYNYDENGESYYCDAAFYMTLPQLDEEWGLATYAQATAAMSATTAVDVTDEPEPASSAMSNGSADENMFDVGFGTPYSTPPSKHEARSHGRELSSAGLSDRHDISPDAIRYEQSYNLQNNSPEKQWPVIASPADDASKPQLEKFEGDKNYDTYGYYIGPRSDDYEYGNELYTMGHTYDPPVAQESWMGRHGSSDDASAVSRHKRNVISFKRRHMHMSDSEEDEEEKLPSIYRTVNRKQTADDGADFDGNNSGGDKYSEKANEVDPHSTETYGFDYDTVKYDGTDHALRREWDTQEYSAHFHSSVAPDEDEAKNVQKSLKSRKRGADDDGKVLLSATASASATVESMGVVSGVNADYRIVKNDHDSASPGPIGAKKKLEAQVEAERKARYEHRLKFMRRGLLHHLTEDDDDNDDDFDLP